MLLRPARAELGSSRCASGSRRRCGGRPAGPCRARLKCRMTCCWGAQARGDPVRGRWHGETLQWLGRRGRQRAQRDSGGRRASRRGARRMAARDPPARCPGSPRPGDRGLASGEPALSERECAAFAARDWLQGRQLRSPAVGRARGLRPTARCSSISARRRSPCGRSRRARVAASPPTVYLSGAMLLAININNTETKVGLFRGESLEATGGSRPRPRVRRTMGATLTSYLAQEGRSTRKSAPRRGVGSAARDPGTVRGGGASDDRAPAGGRRPLPASDYARRGGAAASGADRILNTLAAAQLFRRDTIVVDFGTATTFDCITADGHFWEA